MIPDVGPTFVDSGSHDTRRNLPWSPTWRRTESSFLRRFESVYLSSQREAALASREFAVEGFGRADLVWLAWENSQMPEDFTALALKKRARLTAIEAKVADWRKGLHQAFRYRYFAHRSLLVLPTPMASTAARFLPTFRRLHVGLWGFDVESGRLRKWCTPRASLPLSHQAWERALHLFESHLDLGEVAKGG
jgi:hypothetical protein